MSVVEMMDELVRAGYLVPRTSETPSATLGSYKQVPSITVYGNASSSAIMTASPYAKLEQHLTGN